MGDSVTESLKSVWDSKLACAYENASPADYDVPSDEDSVLCTSAVLLEKFIFNEDTDVVFGFKDEYGKISITYSAHKLVLSIWSPYFAKKFYGKNSKLENITEINETDVEPQYFHYMLRSMYDDSPCIETCKDGLGIYKVAVKYSMHFLIDKTVKYVKNFKPCIADVFEVLEAAIYMDLKHVKNSCLNLIQLNTSTVFEACDVSKISLTVISSILDLQSLSLKSEYDFIEWVLKWAKNKYLTDEKFSSDRELLENFLPKMYFLSLSSKEFAQFYKNHKNFFEIEEAFSILMNIVSPHSVPLPKCQDSEFYFRSYDGPSTSHRRPNSVKFEKYLPNSRANSYKNKFLD